MADGAPQLDLPVKHENLLDLGDSPNFIKEEPTEPANGTTLSSAKDSAVNTASSTMASIADHPVTKDVKDTVFNGPVGQTVSRETAKTGNEFQDLANSRTTPEKPAATGQPLTHYHSLFYRLLSWKNPRATGITFATVVLFIFAARYLNVLRYALKALYTILGVTALAEGAGKALLGNGFATQLRPRKYWTIRKESLERFTEDLEQLINFGIIEFQRVVFVENIWVTAGAFISSFISYYLIKWLPLWGLSLIFTSVAFLGPLVYLQNKELIDAQLNHAGDLINAQASQVRDLAAQHTSQATEAIKGYTGDYTQKAQDYIGQVRGRANGSSTPVGRSEFPAAPKNEPFPNAPKNVPASAEGVAA